MSNQFSINFGAQNSVNTSTRKFPICLVLDTSGSMHGENIRALNENVRNFLTFVENNPKAQRNAEIAIIEFGGDVRVVSGYNSIDNIKFEDLDAYGATPLGAAVEKALSLLDIRRQYYRSNAIEHYKPIMLIMSDGEPTDDYLSVASEVFDMVEKKQLKIFPVGIGIKFNTVHLSRFSPFLKPRLIQKSSDFSELFELLSASSSNPEDDSLDKWFNEDF
jgi:uncharacterized protein YegL